MIFFLYHLYNTISTLFRVFSISLENDDSTPISGKILKSITKVIIMIDFFTSLCCLHLFFLFFMSSFYITSFPIYFLCIHSLTLSLVCVFIFSFIYLFIHSFIYSFIHLFIYLFIHLFIYLFIYLFLNPFIY